MILNWTFKESFAVWPEFKLLWKLKWILRDVLAMWRLLPQSMHPGPWPMSRGTYVTCLLADSTYVVMFTGAQIAALVRSNRGGLRSLATSRTCYHFSNVTYRKNRMVWHVAVKTRGNFFVFRRWKLCRSPFPRLPLVSVSGNDMSLCSRFWYRACRRVAACHGCGLLHNGTYIYWNIEAPSMPDRAMAQRGHSLPRIGFDASLVHVTLTVDTVALWQVSVPVLQFPLPVSFHHCSIPILVFLWRYINLAADSVAIQHTWTIRTQNTSVLKTLGFVGKRNSYPAYLYVVKRRRQ